MSVCEEIFVYTESGNDMIHDSVEDGALYSLLDAYYQHDVYGFDDVEDVPEDAVAEELALPLEERKSGVLFQMEKLLAHGAAVNASGDQQPLMLAVGNLDIAMTEYLLEHGANPHYDLPDEGIPYGCGNYYLDALDLCALDESFVTEPDRDGFDRILRIAMLFAKRGVTDVQTHCISIDSRTRHIAVKQAKMKY